MRSALFLLTLLLAIVLVVARGGATDGRPLVGGIQVNEPDHGAWLDGLDREGLHTVAVTVYAKQGDWDSANLWWEQEESAVVAEIRRAESRGFRTVLVLRVALDHAFERNRFLWHGMIMPRSDAELDEWFARYSRFVAEWAALAEREGVDALAVASEMNALTSTRRVRELPVLEEYWTNAEKVERENARVLRNAATLDRPPVVGGTEGPESLRRYLEDYARAHGAWARQVAYLDGAESLGRINARRARLEAHWREIVRVARSHYRGELTYAANFDQYEVVTFWEALDLIGINAYFPLRDSWTDPRDPAWRAGLRAELRAGWRDVLAAVDRFRGEQGLLGHDVLFTELGYVGRENCSLRPWASQGLAVVPAGEGERLLAWSGQREDPYERMHALGALADLRAEGAAPFLRGVLYWKLSTIVDHREIEPFVLVLDDSRDADSLAALRRIGEAVGGSG